MPHSGGGGSCSGGSYSGGSSGGSSGPSYSRGQSTPYPGSRRYVYYHNNEPHFYYSDRPLMPKDFKSQYWGLIIFGVAWFLIWTILCIGLFERSSGPLDLSDIDKTIYIRDESDIIDDTDEDWLKEYLEEFRDETGVIVSVVTYPYHNIGQSMEVEAYNEYCRMFYDESHWLIYYVGYDYDRTDDWEWHLMCGDDCVTVLSSSQEDKFTREFHKNLLRNMSFASAVVSAINELEPNTGTGFVYSKGAYVNDEYVGGNPVSTLAVLGFYSIALIGLIGAVLGIHELRKPIKDVNVAKMRATVLNGDVSYIKCDYCGGSIVVGTVTKCPYCGANLNMQS